MYYWQFTPKTAVRNYKYVILDRQRKASSLAVEPGDACVMGDAAKRSGSAMKRYAGVSVWIYRPLTGCSHPALAIGAGNALARRIFPRWQSLVQFRTRKPTTHKYSSATFEWGGTTPDDACTPPDSWVRKTSLPRILPMHSFKTHAVCRARRRIVMQCQSGPCTVSSAAQLTLDTPLSMLSRLATASTFD